MLIANHKSIHCSRHLTVFDICNGCLRKSLSRIAIRQTRYSNNRPMGLTIVGEYPATDCRNNPVFRHDGRRLT